MTEFSTSQLSLLGGDDHLTPARIAQSVLSRNGRVTNLADFYRWFSDFGQRAYVHTEHIPLDGLIGWHRDTITGDLHHDSGKFFTVEGLAIDIPEGPVTSWSQPIISQPEIGILGILVKEFGGVLHCLIQAKVEPGNYNGLQLSPTVQATRSNYTRVHSGRAVPYLDYFRETSRHRVIADVRQSEQGSWFHHKRNRNMVVETTEAVEVLDGFCWLSLGQVHQLLAADDLVSMDTRTALSCLPFAGSDVLTTFAPDSDGFCRALIRSCSAREGSVHTIDEILSWITEMRTRTDVYTRRIPLDDVQRWHRTEERISHESGRFFDVIGVRVEAGGREVGQWSQPMIQARDTGVIAFLVTRIGGVLHTMVHARAEPGYVDVVELAPTVQCTPANYEYLPAAARPRFLDDVLRAAPEQIRFDVILSEEGGRFYHARNRYLIIEVDGTIQHEAPEFRWMTLQQLVDLLRHSHYVNVQARSLVACLHSLSVASASDCGLEDGR